MKIGWLVWLNDDDERPTFYKNGEEPAYAHRSVQIVYAEVVDA